jgi:hypothetical protein
MRYFVWIVTWFAGMKINSAPRNVLVGIVYEILHEQFVGKNFYFFDRSLLTTGFPKNEPILLNTSKLIDSDFYIM